MLTLHQRARAELKLMACRCAARTLVVVTLLAVVGSTSTLSGQSEASGQTEAASSRRSQGQPDIVLILADDMGFSDLGCYGSEIETTHLDRLAANGIRFTQFYNTSRCCPSRACLLTGLWPHQAEMGWMTAADMGWPGYRNQLSAATPTIGEQLKAAGYDTYMVGKWHLTHTDDIKNGPNGSWPTERGFDQWYGTAEGAKNYFRPSHLFRNTQRIRSEELPEDYFYTSALADEATSFIKAQPKDRPMFLYMASYAPHFPLQAPQDAIAKQRGRYRDGWEVLRKARFERQKEMGIIANTARLAQNGPSVPAWESLTAEQQDNLDRQMATYAAQIQTLDQSVGRVVAALKAAGRLDNTLILFMSDNGSPGRGGALGTGPQERVGLPSASVATVFAQGWADLSNTPFRLYKQYPHEGGVRTPLIVHWPGKVDKPGSLRHHTGHLVDVAPTLLAAAGVTLASSSKLEGVNLLSIVQDASYRPEADGRRAVCFEHEGRRGMRLEQWKLVAAGAKADWELYDLRSDPTEMLDVADNEPDTVRRLDRMWNEWASRCNVLPLDGSSWNGRIKTARKRKANANE